MTATCRSCGAPIIWARTVNGKAMPLDAEPHADGVLRISDRGVAVSMGSLTGPGYSAETYKSHFATCVNAAKHRKAKS